MKKKYYYSLTFKLEDSTKIGVYLIPDTILLNNIPLIYTIDNYIITIPYINNIVSLDITVNGYQPYHRDNLIGKDINGQKLQLDPKQEDDEITAVTWWEADPHTSGQNTDIDTHVVIMDGSIRKGEVYYNNKLYPSASDPTDLTTIVSLDKDVTGPPYGQNFPETTTIKPFNPNYTYYYVMLDYNKRGNPGEGRIQDVQLHCRLSKGDSVQTITCPNTGNGRFWNVFKIENGEIQVINQISDTNDYNITI